MDRLDRFDALILARIQIVEEQPDGFAKAGFSRFIRAVYKCYAAWTECYVSGRNTPVIGKTKANKLHAASRASRSISVNASRAIKPVSPPSSIFFRSRCTVR